MIYFDHAALRHLLSKKEAKSRLIRWILLLQKFLIEISDKKGSDNVVASVLNIGYRRYTGRKNYIPDTGYRVIYRDMVLNTG